MVRVVPVEIGDGLLQTKEVVHCVDDDVHRGGIACLCPQVVLKACKRRRLYVPPGWLDWVAPTLVVSLTEQLQEMEEGHGEC